MLQAGDMHEGSEKDAPKAPEGMPWKKRIYKRYMFQKQSDEETRLQRLNTLGDEKHVVNLCATRKCMCMIHKKCYIEAPTWNKCMICTGPADQELVRQAQLHKDNMLKPDIAHWGHKPARAD